jgi:hypothetical protein
MKNIVNDKMFVRMVVVVVVRWVTVRVKGKGR